LQLQVFLAQLNGHNKAFKKDAKNRRAF